MLFADWVPESPEFSYVFDPDQTTYAGKWLAPYRTTAVALTQNLIDPAQRFRYYLYGNYSAGVPFPYHSQIIHGLLPRLTAQRAGMKVVDGFTPNALNPDGSSVDLNSGSNILQNADWCAITVEWLPQPQNGYGINAAWVEIRGEGAFDEIGENETILTPIDIGGANRPGGSGVGMGRIIQASGPYMLQKPLSINSPTNRVTVTYDWVEKGLVDLPAMEEMKGTLNYWDVGMWKAGTLLYENSDVTDMLSPLGYRGYKIVHHFSTKTRDWNIVPIIPKPVTSDQPATGSGVNEVQNPDFPAVNWGWATVRPPYNSTVTTAPTFAIGVLNLYDHHRNRKYKYSAFQVNRLNSKLFYYGLSATAPVPVNPINPNSATATPPTPPVLS